MIPGIKLSMGGADYEVPPLTLGQLKRLRPKLKDLASGDGNPWPHIYGLLATACGYSYPIIDAMTLWDVMELGEYWAENPPVHILVAAYLGFKGEPAVTPSFNPDDYRGINDNWQQELAAIPGAAAGPLPTNLPDPVLDFEALM